MSSLLIVSDVSGNRLRRSPLAKSLTKQTDEAWTFDPETRPIRATVMVDHTSQLRPGAVAAIRAAMADNLRIDALIGDAIISGRRSLRPGWSPSRVANDPSGLDLLVTRASHTSGSLADRIDALRTANQDAVGHLPAALLERSGPVPVDLAAINAIDEFSSSRLHGDTITSVSFVVAATDATNMNGRPWIEGAVAAARAGGITEHELIAVVSDDRDASTFEDMGVTVITTEGDSHQSRALNQGLLAARHEAVVILDERCELSEPGWLLAMTHHLQDPHVGAVGAAVLFADQTVHHLGLVIDDALPLRSYVGHRLEDLPAAATHTREVIAVSKRCLVARRDDLLAVGGFNETLSSDLFHVDACLKLQRAGKRILVEPAAQLVLNLDPSHNPEIDPGEWASFLTRWGQIDDPWYHPGHFRPDDPANRRQNADYLPPADPLAEWPMRTTAIRPSVYRPRHPYPALTHPSRYTLA